MKYVITGGAGHISKPLTEKLLSAGHQVTVIGRNADNLKELTKAGAVAAIGSVEDVDFLTETFKGADAVYTMVPPKWDAEDWKGYIGKIGATYAASIAAAGIKYVVNLSSVGAHLADGCGPVSGLYRVEQALNQLKQANIKHLRPAYFYQNLLSNVGLIKQAGIMGANYSLADHQFPIADPQDIAEVASEELLSLHFTGSSVRYVASDETSTGSIARAIGSAIGKPGIPWVTFSGEEAFQGMRKGGLSEEVAKNYVEMGEALGNGKMTSDYWNNKPTLGKVRLNDFANVFAAVYNAS